MWETSALVVWAFSFQGIKEPQKRFQQHASEAVPILDIWGPYAKLCPGGGGGDGWDAFVRVSLRLESHSRKALEKQYLFRGSYKLSFFFFFKQEQETGRHSRYMIWLICK